MANLTNINNKFLVTTGGNVGINTTSPGAKLDINGATYVRNVIYGYAGGGNQYGGLSWASTDTGFLFLKHNNVTKAVINANDNSYFNGGNVGIGTASPEEKLDVTGSVLISNNEFYKVENTSGTNYKIAGLTSGNEIQIGAIDYTTAGTIFAGGDNISITTGGASGTTRMKIDSSGNVGIGTSSPDGKLDVKGDGADIFLHSNDYKIARIQPRGTGGNYDIGLFSLFSGSTENVRIDAGGNSWFNGGNIGIGTTSPNGRLNVSNGGANGLEIDPTQSSGATTLLQSYNRSGSAYTLMRMNAGSYEFQIADSTKMRIASNGRVGIGTTVPVALLHLKQANGANIRFENGTTNRVCTVGEGVGTNDVFSFRGNSYRSTDTLSVVFSTDRVGIGIITPNEKLQVAGNIHAYAPSGIDAGLFASTAAGNTTAAVRSSGVSHFNGGNVGIGTTSPSRKLDVRTDNGVLIKGASGSTNGKLSFVPASGGRQWDFQNNSSNFQIKDESAGITRMFFHYNGRLAIGSNLTDPLGQVDIYRAAGLSGTAAIAITNGESNGKNWGISTEVVGGGDFALLQSASTGGTPTPSAANVRFIINNSGNVGIGTTSPTYKFHVASSNNVSIFEDTSGSSGATFCLFNAPSVFAMGSITRNASATSVLFNTVSDYRLKEDLQNFNALDLVNNITAYDYKWKDVEQRDYGFIAHELKQTLPNVVTGEKDGEKMQSVDYSKLTPILLKAIQELEARVKELENK